MFQKKMFFYALLQAFLLATLILVIIPAIFGKSFGIREIYVHILIKIFEVFHSILLILFLSIIPVY